MVLYAHPGSLSAALMGVETERPSHSWLCACAFGPWLFSGLLRGTRGRIWMGFWGGGMACKDAMTPCHYPPTLPPFPFQPPMWCCNRHAQSHGESRDVPGAAVQHGEPPNKQNRHGDKWGRHGDGMGTGKELGSP